MILGRGAATAQSENSLLLLCSSLDQTTSKLFQRHEHAETYTYKHQPRFIHLILGYLERNQERKKERREEKRKHKAYHTGPWLDREQGLSTQPPASLKNTEPLHTTKGNSNQARTKQGPSQASKHKGRKGKKGKHGMEKEKREEWNDPCSAR